MILPESIRRRWHSGEMVDIMRLEDELIKTVDVVTVLKRMPRWGASGRYVVTVAEHSVMVVRLAFDEGERDPAKLLEYLLHDTTEAFVSDMVGPLKRELPLYKAIEARVRHGLSTHFGIEVAQPEYVHRLDKEAESIEWDYLFGEVTVSPRRHPAYRLSRGSMFELWQFLIEAKAAGADEADIIDILR